MERRKEDRRIRITKQAIRESMIELMQEQTISKISVKMICESADINRSTFYTHYKDQYDLLKTIQKEVIEDLKKRISSTQFFEASDNAFTTLVQILEYAKENSALLKILLNDASDTFFQNELMQLAHEKIIEEYRGNTTLTSRNLQYIRCFALSGHLSIMQHWLEENCIDETEALAKLMMNLMSHGTGGLYKAPEA